MWISRKGRVIRQRSPPPRARECRLANFADERRTRKCTAEGGNVDIGICQIGTTSEAKHTHAQNLGLYTVHIPPVKSGHFVKPSVALHQKMGEGLDAEYKIPPLSLSLFSLRGDKPTFPSDRERSIRDRSPSIHARPGHVRT